MVFSSEFVDTVAGVMHVTRTKAWRLPFGPGMHTRQAKHQDAVGGDPFRNHFGRERVDRALVERAALAGRGLKAAGCAPVREPG